VNDAWRLVFDEEAFQFVLARRLRERLVLFKTLDSLKADPYQAADFEVPDTTDRTLSVRRARPFLVTYWLDAAVKEVRVVNIELVATI
jgi:hypothetical protein